MAIIKVSKELLREDWALKLLTDYFDEVRLIKELVLESDYYVYKNGLNIPEDKVIDVQVIQLFPGKIVIHKIDDIIINPIHT